MTAKVELEPVLRIVAAADALLSAVNDYRSAYYDVKLAVEDPVRWARNTTDADAQLSDAVRDYLQARKPPVAAEPAPTAPSGCVSCEAARPSYVPDHAGDAGNLTYHCGCDGAGRRLSWSDDS